MGWKACWDSWWLRSRGGREGGSSPCQSRVSSCPQALACVLYACFILGRLCVPVFANMSREPFSTRALLRSVLHATGPGKTASWWGKAVHFPGERLPGQASLCQSVNPLHTCPPTPRPCSLPPSLCSLVAWLPTTHFPPPRGPGCASPSCKLITHGPASKALPAFLRACLPSPSLPSTLGSEPKASYMPDKSFTIEPHPYPPFSSYFETGSR